MPNSLKIKLLSIVLPFLCLFACSGQSENKQNELSNDFDKSVPIYYGMPDVIEPRDTSPGWDLNGQKILITGTVYEMDGKTPAPNILIYYYQTDINGKYLHQSGEKRSMPPNDLGQTHGYIRGWMKTDKDGKYYLYTVRPGSYPGRDEPAHIHLNIKEQGLKDHYYIDDFVFDDDKLLSAERRQKMENRGGSGVLRLLQKGNLHIGERDIILGLNIPDYPKERKSKNPSGKSIGEDVNSFTPFHAWGPDKGSKTCPVCKYGWYHGILYFVGNNPDWNNIKQWLSFLENESLKREKHLKIYFIYGNEEEPDRLKKIKKLERIGAELSLEKIALTFVPSFSDKPSEIYLNRINPELENTFILYRRSIIIDKFLNLKPNPENFKKISNRLDETINEYFDLPRARIE